MDLNSIMNSDGGAGGASRPPAPPSLAKTPSSGPPPPHTPVQAHHPAHAFRDYSQTVHASPGPAPAASPREHPSSAHPGFPTPGPYASPTSYNAPPGAFPPRPPPIQPPSAAHDPRSPGSASASHPSPYRHTPTSSLSAASGAYPFPPQGQSQPPASPQQRHQYGQQPGAYPRDSRDSHSSQPGSAPVGMPTHHGSMSYVPGQQAVPQTPPVGTPGGGNHAYMLQQQQQQQQQMLQQQQQQQQQHHHMQQQLHQQQQQQQHLHRQQHHHQRSQSAQSATTSTPTSAHAPHPPPGFGTPSAYGHPHGSMGSPVVMTHQPHFDQQNQNHQRQPSQPPTPLSGSLSMTPRQSSGVANNSINFSQPPPSPYQQRAPPSAAPLSTYPSHPQHLPTQPSPYHNSPPPPPPSAISRIPSTSSHTVPYDGASDSHRRSQSQASRSERDRSISVSPKTRVPSLPSSAGDIPTTNTRPPSSKGPIPIPPAAPLGPSQPPNIPPAPAVPTHSASAMEGVQHQHPLSQRENTLAKRKMDDRDLRPDEVEGATDRRPPPPGVNGNHGGKNAMPRQSASPKMARRKKARYHATPPAWAASCRSHQPEASRNYCLSSKSHHPTTPTAGGLVNGNGHPNAEGSIKSEHASRHASPEAARSVGGGPAVKLEDSQPPPIVAARDDAAFQFEGRPFPLQCVNLLQKQLDYTVKAVGDHLYFNVINNPNLAEIQARGIHFEIEVKFGTIIDRNSETRLSLPFPCGGEVILPPDARIGFRSSMAENQHREINQWLNATVCATNERNPPGGRPNPPHVPMHYTHRRETDRFYELNQALVPRLPFAMQKAVGPRNPLKVRVSTDQKTNKMLAKIVKTRVGDLNIFMPHHPVDCRISINLEWDWDGPMDEIVSNQIAGRGQPDRNKDRLSYEHGFFQVDLTQVTKPGPPPSKEHELEIEMNANILLEHGRRLIADPPQENKYQDLVETLVDNIRAVAKKCPQAA